MSSAVCARCTRPFTPGALVVDVRVVTRYVDENDAAGVATDRTSSLAHLECPSPNQPPQVLGDWDHVLNRPATIYTPPEDRVARPTYHQFGSEA